MSGGRVEQREGAPVVAALSSLRRELQPPLIDTVKDARRFARDHALRGSFLHQLRTFCKVRGFGLPLLPPMPLVGLTVDVGANRGAFTHAILSIEPRAHVVAIEPGIEAAATLTARFGDDPRVHIETCAVSDGAGVASFNVAAQSEFSSLLSPVADLTTTYGPGAEIVDTVPVATHALDDLISGPVTLLKVDVQGAERQVFAGAARTLANTRSILVEALITPHYEDEMSFPDLHALLTAKGFLFTGLTVPSHTARTLWCDVCYVRA